MVRVLATTMLALLGAVGVVVTTAVPAPGTMVQVSSSQSSEQPLSAAVVANWIAHRDTAGDLVLDLLVLWRGTPGWWLTEGPHSGSGGGTGTITRMVLSRGGRELTASFDARTHVANVQGKEITLNDANVVLVDGVDAADGLKIVRTMTVAPLMSAPPRIDTTILSSPDLIAYLRCDVRLPDARKQAIVDVVCSPFAGKAAGPSSIAATRRRG
jgi:hypothetical protein